MSARFALGACRGNACVTLTMPYNALGRVLKYTAPVNFVTVIGIIINSRKNVAGVGDKTRNRPFFFKFAIVSIIYDIMSDWQERTELLVGAEGLKKLREAHVLIVGLGGVGSYAAEMLCRAGVGSFTVVDCDTVSASNINRQLIATADTVGMNKTDAVAERMKSINPEVNVLTVREYITEENVDAIIEPRYDYVVDAIDTPSPKTALIKACVGRAVPLVSSMGAGAKFDPCRVKIDDISKSKYCPLARMIRKRLGKSGIKRGFKAVYSDETPVESAMIACDERNKKTIAGTISYMPAVFGCCCASAVIEDILAR